MQLVRTPPGLRQVLDPARRDGAAVALVPTMGALHDGHLSLVRVAIARSTVAVVSVFVNPLQFGPTEDLAAYPRDLARDVDLLRRVGADVVFAPDAATFTPPDRRTTVHVEGLTAVLEGASRPGHFDGVTTIVTKLFSVVRPDVAVFGEKDYQQLVVIRQMVADLNLGVEVVGCPIVREENGLALSSRNAYLSPAERASATALSRALEDVAGAWAHDQDADRARESLRTTLAAAPGIRLDYAEICDPRTLEPLTGTAPGPARALVAAFVGRTRLIDNTALDPAAAP